MDACILVKDSHKYSGKYVAVRSVRSKTVICSGINPARVMAAARKKGAKEPAIFFIPQKDTVYIY
jgi:hypothetical protein